MSAASLAQGAVGGQQFSRVEAEAMQMALAAALAGPRGANPLVGAAIIGTDGQLLFVGHHRGAGTPHAEADALAQARAAGTSVLGATMVVTLEPCNHTGRTGPCAQAIIDAGIARVIYAVNDPHDPAAGGAQRLSAAGVDVAQSLGAEEATELNRQWFAAVAARRPFVTLHLAQSLDGRIAAEDGTSQWISGPESLADNHAQRRLIDAILVGSGTVRIDDPRLTAREADGTLSARQPLRAVMGLRPVPAEARVHGDGRLLHLATREPEEALRQLFAHGVRHVMVEGGSSIISAFLQARLVDELILYLAPILIGSGTPALDGIGVGTLGQAQGYEWDPAGGAAIQHLGRDLRLHLKPRAEPTTEVAAVGEPGAAARNKE